MAERETELRFPSGYVTHTLMPPHEPDGYTTVSHPLSIGVSFTGHVKAVIESPSGKVSQRTYAPGTFGITGADAVKWLRVTEPSEAVEIYPASSHLLQVEHDTGVAWRSQSSLLRDQFDPIIWAVCARFRMAALGTSDVSDLEAEQLIGSLLTHVAVRHLGGRAPGRVRGKLNARRLARVAELVESRLRDPPGLHEMAQAAALSAFHFQRLFAATTGLSPHEYVAARRMEAARRMLEGPGVAVAHVAATLGFSDLAHFRRSFRRQFKVSPRGKP